MISDSYSTMRSNVGMQSTLQSNNNEELGFLIRRQEMMEETERELNMYHSSSAPPSVEDSMSAVGGISEEGLRSDPVYLSYYYENVNMNPRLPKPLVSKEELRYSQRIQGGGGSPNGGWRNSDDGVIGGKVQQVCNVDWEINGLIGLGSKQKSIADMFQDNITHPSSAPKHPSHSTSCSLFDENVEHSELHYSQLQQELASMGDAHAGANIQGMSSTQNIGLVSPHMFSSTLGTPLSRNITPGPQILTRIPSPRISSVGGRCSSLNIRNTNGANSVNNVLPVSDPEYLTAALSEISLSVSSVLDEDSHARPKTQRHLNNLPNLFHSHSNSNHIKEYPHFNNSESRQLHLGSVSKPATGSYGGGVDVDWSNYSLFSDMQAEVHKPTVVSTNSYLKEPSTSTLINGGDSFSQYHTMDSPNSPLSNYGLSGYDINLGSLPMLGNHLGSGCFPPLFESVATAKAMEASDIDSRVMGGLALEPNLIAVAAQLQKRNRVRSLNAGSALQLPHVDPLYLQYSRSNAYAAAQLEALNEQKLNNYMGLLELQKSYLGASTSSQKSRYGLPYLGDPAGLGHGYFGHPAIGLDLPYLGNPMVGSLLPDFPMGSGTPIMPSDGSLSFPPGIMNLNLIGGLCHPETHSMLHESSASSLLEEFKNSKTRCFELSEIAGHVVEFSGDQYGSRLIQQKIETATTEERIMVFNEIMPKALSLMTDVFGNYVIQKLFELGNPSQIKELADQLNGHVLALSLQMYGCRVIQKAIEVVSLDQQIKMVAELDGHVSHCVRDQNANHVIQKCIQCIPEYAIQIIVSTFHAQVVILATHPYGCRVIQRVLENCRDPKILQIVMDEILQSVCMLAQDQYGNYVVQHVLEHGTPDECTFMINKFSGKIVEMSYQRYASNVVEKCLAFGTPEERKSIVNEMLVSSDENEPLQAMMKDQFANYVVQKVLETCDDQQLELIFEKIKVNLNVLKKYTYGKHIVARVEKLVAAGERRIGALALYSDSTSANAGTTAGAAASTADGTNATAEAAI